LIVDVLGSHRGGQGFESPQLHAGQRPFPAPGDGLCGVLATEMQQSRGSRGYRRSVELLGRPGAAVAKITDGTDELLASTTTPPSTGRWHSGSSKPPNTAGAPSTHHLVTLVRAGARFDKGVLTERDPRPSPRKQAKIFLPRS
jgi:hypothetical protein